GVPLFSNLDDFRARIATVPGLSVSNFGFDESNGLSMQLSFTATLLGRSDPIQFNISLPPLSNMQADGNATIGGSATINLGFQVKTLDGAATVVSQAGMAANGQISADAVLRLVVNGTPVSVLVPHGVTLGNHNVNEFIAELNASLAR